MPLRVWVVVDQHFEQRFGPLDGSGRERLNQWLYLAERQFGQAFERKLALRLVGVGRWRLADGPTKLGEVFGHQVPRSLPTGSGADCLIAVASRRDINWGGMSSWPRVLVKAQVHEPSDMLTTALLCHEMSHWLGAVDIDDTHLGERSVMNYRDERSGWVDGRLAWDTPNRRRMADTLARWGI